jgi:hypothetical protein
MFYSIHKHYHIIPSGAASTRKEAIKGFPDKCFGFSQAFSATDALSQEISDSEISYYVLSYWQKSRLPEVAASVNLYRVLDCDRERAAMNTLLLHSIYSPLRLKLSFRGVTPAPRAELLHGEASMSPVQERSAWLDSSELPANEASSQKCLDLSHDIPSLPTVTAQSATPKTIRVRETIPEHFTGVGSLDSWRMMARQEAFNLLFQQVKPTDVFRAQCFLSEAWERSETGIRKDLVIICDLDYWIEDAVEG